MRNSKFLKSFIIVRVKVRLLFRLVFAKKLKVIFIKEMHRSKKDSVHSFITTKDVIPAGVSSADQSKKTGML